MTVAVTTAPLDRCRRLPRPAAGDLTLTRAVPWRSGRLPLNPIPPGAPDGRWTEQSHGPARRLQRGGEVRGTGQTGVGGEGRPRGLSLPDRFAAVASGSIVGVTELRSTVKQTGNDEGLDAFSYIRQ